MLASPALQDHKHTHTTAHIKQYRHGNSFRTVNDYDLYRRGEQSGEGISLFTTTPRPTLWSTQFLTHQNTGRRDIRIWEKGGHSAAINRSILSILPRSVRRDLTRLFVMNIQCFLRGGYSIFFLTIM